MTSSDHGYVKLNFDGLVALDKATTGFAIRNDIGHLISGGAINFDGASISEVEARGLRVGLLYALRKEILNIMVEGDSSHSCSLRSMFDPIEPCSYQ